MLSIFTLVVSILVDAESTGAHTVCICEFDKYLSYPVFFKAHANFFKFGFA